MREILFRGKELNSGKWVIGDLLSDYNNYFYVIRIKTQEVIPIDKESVSQYTGLKDKNGTKIFDNDIVKFGNLYVAISWNEAQAKYVFYNSGIKDIGLHVFMQIVGHCEVVGNKYENLELLEVKDERDSNSIN